MLTLTSCPACNEFDFVKLRLPTNVSEEQAAKYGNGVVTDSKFALCRRCDLVFARQRQDETDIDEYYDAFQELERREYAVYPPPRRFIELQQQFSDRLLSRLDAARVLKKESSVLNIRSECGILLARLRDEYGFSELYGLDHFESNIRYARDDLGLRNVDFLNPLRIDNPFPRQQFDLILANHQVTHALEPLELLATMREMLTETGVLVLYNEADHVRVLRNKGIHRGGAINYHKQLLSKRSLRNLCLLAGLSWELLECNPRGIQWAAPKHSMLVISRRAAPLEAAQLQRSRFTLTRSAIALGETSNALYGSTKYLERLILRRAA